MCRFKYTVDAERVLALWDNHNYTRAEIARELGLSERQLQDVSERFRLGPRGACHRAFSMQEGSPEDEAASANSLRLSPWVARRIEELKLGMPA